MFRTTTDSKHDFPIAPNVLDRDFTASAPDRALGHRHHRFSGRPQGWLYLAVILDLFSGRVVGWATSARTLIATSLAALAMALDTSAGAAAPVFGSRSPLRSRQHVREAHDYRKALDAKGLRVQRMSRKGDCWDNAVAESFFSTLKRELELESMTFEPACRGARCRSATTSTASTTSSAATLRSTTTAVPSSSS